MKNNLTTAQWSKVLGWEKVDSEWYLDENGARHFCGHLYDYQANTRIDFEKKTITMIDYYMRHSLSDIQRGRLFEKTGCNVIIFVDNYRGEITEKARVYKEV